MLNPKMYFEPQRQKPREEGSARKRGGTRVVVRKSGCLVYLFPSTKPESVPEIFDGGR